MDWGEMNGKYKFALPCKLGEKFISLKFVKWENAERLYKDDNEVVLTGFDKSLFGIVCYGNKNGIPNGFYSYDEYGRGYRATCSVYVDLKYFENTKLSEWGFPSDKTGHLIGFEIKDGFEVAEFCIEPRYEHVYYAIKKLSYDDINNEIIYDDVAEVERVKIKKTVKESPHREYKITLSEEEKNKIIKKIIADTGAINLKLRRNDIAESNIHTRLCNNGDISISCVLDLEELGTRAKRIPRNIRHENISIINKRLYIFYIK